MKKMVFFILLFSLAFFVFSDNKEKEKKQPVSIPISAGLAFSYEKIDIKTGDSAAANSLTALSGIAEIAVDISDYLTVGVLAGYNRSTIGSPLNFTTLPLSVQITDKAANNNGLIWGASVKSEPFSWDDFSLSLKASFVNFSQSAREWSIALNNADGSLNGKLNFFILKVNAVVNYQGLSNFIIFAGPEFSMISGKYNMDETIVDIVGSEEITIKQKSFLTAVAGITWQGFDFFDLTLSGSYFGRKSIALSLVHNF